LACQSIGPLVPSLTWYVSQGISRIRGEYARTFCTVCEVFFWRYVTPLFTVTYEPYQKGD
jgi:hypothetical protein